MFGIGAATTGIAREWHHGQEWGACVPDEGKAGLVTGLVLSSLLFGVLILFTGRRRRKAPILQAGIGRFVMDDDVLHRDDLPQPSPTLGEG
jgi:hypothetical protein